MTTPLLLEEESGSFTGRRHPHNGYYAGDFFGHSSPPLLHGTASSAEPDPRTITNGSTRTA
jgi:hypothetical protein